MKKQKSSLVLLYHFAVLFFFIANVNIGFITTRRISLIVAFIVIVQKWSKLKSVIKVDYKKLSWAVALLSGCFIITMSHIIGARPSEMSVYFTPQSLLSTLIGMIAMGLWCVLELKSFERFAKLVVAIVVLQSFFTYFSAVYSPFRIYVAEHFMTESYQARAFNTIYGLGGGRAAGLGIGWSSGSLILAYGCLMLISLKKYSQIKMFWFGVLYAIILGATALMGRLGLLLEIVFLLYYSFVGGKIKNIFAIGLIAIVVYFTINGILSTYDADKAATRLEWMLEFMDSKRVNEINNAILDDGFPAFNEDFIFGTGLILGRYHGGYNFTADSGYVRIYTSIGVVGMTCYYLGIFLLLIATLPKHCPSKMRNLFFLGLLAIFISEYKEPFIGMTVCPCLMFTFGMLYNIDSKLYRQ